MGEPGRGVTGELGPANQNEITFSPQKGFITDRLTSQHPPSDEKARAGVVKCGLWL